MEQKPHKKRSKKEQDEYIKHLEAFVAMKARYKTVIQSENYYLFNFIPILKVKKNSMMEA